MAMKEEQKKKLWDAYKKNKTPEIREQLIIEYANLVNQIIKIWLNENCKFG